ncbi:MAG TPA: mandelate racemase/muconate lactonizing enzyme family protein [Acidimicrobiales bacterium]|nr:mandelate racemase/muconate lactonizing enzyme family protein [Acidimicrobiales bacterium]
MRIDGVRVGHVSVPMARPMRTAIHETTHTEVGVVEIHAGGLAGQGVTLSLRPHQAQATCAMLADLSEGLGGAEADDVTALWDRMWVRLSLTGQSGIGVLALSAIDTALWDLLAQQAGLPLHRLFGTRWPCLPVYAQPGWLSYSVGELCEEALSFQEQGFRYYKMRVGSPDWRSDVHRVEQVRSALGDTTQVLVDANQGWSRREALAAGRALDDLGLYWLEEPVDVADLEGCAAVARAISTPVAAGESVFGTAGFQPLIDHGAAAILMPDLQHCGGPSGFHRVAVQADLAGLPISSHMFTQVSVHLMASSRNALLVEHMPGWWEHLFQPELDIQQGMIRPPSTPGTGFKLVDWAGETLNPVP